MNKEKKIAKEDKVVVQLNRLSEGDKKMALGFISALVMVRNCDKAGAKA